MSQLSERKRSESHSTLEKLDEEKVAVSVQAIPVLEDDDASEHIDDTIIKGAEDIAVQVCIL